MKKQALFAVCLTAATAAVFTGCATKQEAAARQSQMEATEVTAAETQEMEAAVCEETVPEVTPAETNPAEVTPAETAAPEVAATPAETAPEAAPEQKAELVKTVHPQPVAYTVTAGDSVSALAVRFGVRRPDILALNPNLRKNPNDLRIGQKVLLPAGTDVTKKAQRRASSAQPANAKRPEGSVVYVVKSGDVLGGIAIKHGVSVAAIKSANNLKKDMIWVGQKLTIPGATKKPVEKKVAKPAEKKQPAPGPVVTPKDAPVQQPVEVPAPVVEELPPAPAPEVPAPVVEEALPEQAGEDALLPPEPIPAAPEAAPAIEQSERVYVVQEGEDLVGIAMKWGVSPAELRALNGFDDATAPELVPGTTLRLPMPATVK